MAKRKPKAEPAELPSAFSLFKPSWEAVKINISTFTALVLLPAAYFILIGLTFGSPSATADPQRSAASVPLLLAGFAFTLLVAPALPYVQLKSSRGEEITLGQAMRAGMRYFWKFYGISILSGLAILGGFLLLIVPGFYMLRRYLLAPYYLYDHDIGVIEAMKQSAADSKSFAGAIWGLIGVTVLVALPGFVPLVGAIISLGLQITYYCAPSIRYLQIHHEKKHKAH